MKTRTTEELLRELAAIQKLTDQYDERATIATEQIEKTPYAEEIRFVYAAIDRLDVRAEAIRQIVRARVAQDVSRCYQNEIYPGVVRKTTATQDVTISKDLSMYLEDVGTPAGGQ